MFINGDEDCKLDLPTSSVYIVAGYLRLLSKITTLSMSLFTYSRPMFICITTWSVCVLTNKTILTLLSAKASVTTHPYPPSGGTLFTFVIVSNHITCLKPKLSTVMSTLTNNLQSTCCYLKVSGLTTLEGLMTCSRVPSVIFSYLLENWRDMFALCRFETNSQPVLSQQCVIGSLYSLLWYQILQRVGTFASSATFIYLLCVNSVTYLHVIALICNALECWKHNCLIKILNHGRASSWCFYNNMCFLRIFVYFCWFYK